MNICRLLLQRNGQYIVHHIMLLSFHAWEKLSFSQLVFASCTGVMSNVDLMVQSREMYDPHYKQCDDSYDRLGPFLRDKTINNTIDLNLSESINFFLSINNNTVSVIATDTT